MRSLLHLRSVHLVVWCLLGVLLCVFAIEARGQGVARPPTVPANQGAKTWRDISVSNPRDRITVHYHRPDGSYEGVNLWTWDGAANNTPLHNALVPVGRDEFGAVFQLDRAKYGGSSKIGLIPRVGSDWNQKDGGDRFWNPALGNEVWLVMKKDAVLAQPPDVSPRVESAYLDALDKIAVRLTRPAPSGAKAVLLNEEGAVEPTSTETGATRSELAVTPQGALDITRRYTMRLEGFGAAVPLTPRGLLDDRELFFDDDAMLGATYTPEATTFRVFAPMARAVSLVVYNAAAGNTGRSVTALQSQPKGLWESAVEGDLSGKFYTYLIDNPSLSGPRETLDPYATNSVGNSTRALITAPSPAMPPGPPVASPVDMVVYEMHVRDFTIAPNSGVQNRGLYLGFTEPNTTLPGHEKIRTALDHLTELGVTHVQILPVHDFPNDEARRQYNWGYMTSGFFSPEGIYATEPNNDSRVRELKALVTALHARGIGVLLDVVYNHTAEEAPYKSIAPDYYYRRLPDGTFANGSACGNEFRSEAPMARKLIIDSLKHWVQEYGIDGFRFDLMGLIDQETMREAERELRAINPHIVLYGEPWTASATPLREKADKQGLRDVQPIGAFNDDYRNSLKGPPEGAEPGWIQNGSKRDALKTAMLVSDWFASPEQAIEYMTCHDNLVLWDKLKISMPGASDALLKETMKLGYLALFTSQGVPFIHGGEEFARSKGGNHNSYEAPDSVNQVDWSLKQKHFDLFAYTRDAIALRKAHPIFRLRTRAEVVARLRFATTPNEKTLVFTLDGAGLPGETWKRVCVMLNADNAAPAEVALPPGDWTVALDERGAASARTVTLRVSVRQKSGLVLYQE